MKLDTGLKLEAMPSLVDSTDFGLDSLEHNKGILQKLMKRRPTILKHIDDATLYSVGSNDGGYYFLVKDFSIVYLSKYKRLNRKLMGQQSLVQTSVWRTFGVPEVKGLVTEVMFNYIMPRFGSITSDRLHTENGRRLWIDFLGLALKQKLNVALISFNMSKVLRIESMIELRLWNNDVHSIWSWNSNKRQGLRFLISKTHIACTDTMTHDLVDKYVPGTGENNEQQPNN